MAMNQPISSRLLVIIFGTKCLLATHYPEVLVSVHMFLHYKYLFVTYSHILFTFRSGNSTILMLAGLLKQVNSR